MRLIKVFDAVYQKMVGSLECSYFISILTTIAIKWTNILHLDMPPDTKHQSEKNVIKCKQA